MKTKSNLARVLENGQFVVTAEISSPQNTDFETIRENANLIKDYVDAFNVPDGQAAVVAMASWAVCLVGIEEGIDAIAHMTCRDRNRIALQMDILAISASGVLETIPRQSPSLTSILSSLSGWSRNSGMKGSLTMESP